MEKIKGTIRLLWKLLLYFVLAIFAPIYFGWLALVPLTSFSYSGRNFFYGLIRSLLCVASIILARRTMSRSWIGLIFLIPAMYLGISAYSHAVNYFPSIEDVAKHDGTIYIITNSRSIYYNTRPRNQDVLTKVKWGIIPFSIVLPPSSYHLKLTYDSKAHLVSVVERSALDFEPLLYTDSDPPRVFAFWVFPAEFEGKRYYLTFTCNPSLRNLYDCIAVHTLYQCELDNTSCMSFPFLYTEQENQVEEVVMDRDSTTGNINVYFYWHGETTLIFSNGDNPRCYVEGCEIVKQP